MCRRDIAWKVLDLAKSVVVPLSYLFVCVAIFGRLLGFQLYGYFVEQCNLLEADGRRVAIHNRASCHRWVGIIGGTGLDDPDILTERSEKLVDTPYGKPSDSLICGKIGNVDCVLLARHNRKHGVSPTFVNYRANIYALWKEGCSMLIVTTACGSLREHMHPGDVVIIDQFIDRTYRRECSFYDGKEGHLKGIRHVAMGEPFCTELREILIDSVKSLNIPYHVKGTMVTIEGPRFSSRAESNMFRLWNGDVINMTTVPEVALANELALPYAAIGLVTDYDSWHEDPQHHVDVKTVKKVLSKNTEKAVKILRDVIPKLPSSGLEEVIRKYKERAENSLV